MLVTMASKSECVCVLVCLIVLLTSAVQVTAVSLLVLKYSQPVAVGSNKVKQNSLVL